MRNTRENRAMIALEAISNVEGLLLTYTEMENASTNEKEIARLEKVRKFLREELRLWQKVYEANELQ